MNFTYFLLFFPNWEFQKVSCAYKLRKSADGLSPVWKGILTQSFTARKLSNQKSTANIVSTTRKTTLCWLRTEIKEHHSFISIDILNCISVWRSGRNEEGERRVTFPLPNCFSFCSLFFLLSPSSERLHGAGYCGATRLWPQERRTSKLIMTVLFAGADRKRSL